MNKVLMVFALLAFQFAQGQGSNSCAQVLKRKIQFDTNDPNSLLKLIESFSALSNCGLDEGDIEVLTTGPLVGTILIQLSSEKNTSGKITYQNVYDKFKLLQETEDYQALKSTIIVSNEFGRRQANIENWEEDKLLLTQLSLGQEEIDEFHDYLKQHSDPNKSYEEVYKNYQAEKYAAKSTIKTDSDQLYANPGNVDFDNLLKESIRMNKPLLIYFTGYACVNCRKMENNILNSDKVSEELLKNYYFVNLYVDDQTKLPESEWYQSPTTKRQIKTVGQKNIDLQVSRYLSNVQPYFVLINAKGDKIADLQYTRDESEFINFLNQYVH